MAHPHLTDPIVQGLLQSDQALAYWQAATAGKFAPSLELEIALAQDILSNLGQIPPEALLKARGPMLARAASRVRAQKMGPACGPYDSAIEHHALSHAHRGFFGVEVMDFAHRRYNGAMSEVIQREVFTSTDVVTVLPYDPARDLVLMVEQIRSGPIARGGGAVWLLETVAGRIDAGETPDEAARRETLEEAGLELQQLLPIGNFYPSPGAASEFAYNYIALCDLSAQQNAIHGLAEEGEDIRSLILPFDQALDLVQSGKIQTAPLMISLLWLKSERGGLRKS